MRLPQPALRFGAGLRGETEIRPDPVAWSALRLFLFLEWSSLFPRSSHSFFL